MHYYALSRLGSCTVEPYETKNVIAIFFLQKKLKECARACACMRIHIRTQMHACAHTYTHTTCSFLAQLQAHDRHGESLWPGGQPKAMEPPLKTCRPFSAPSSPASGERGRRASLSLAQRVAASVRAGLGRGDRVGDRFMARRLSRVQMRPDRISPRGALIEQAAGGRPAETSLLDQRDSVTPITPYPPNHPVTPITPTPRTILSPPAPPED